VLEEAPASSLGTTVSTRWL